MIDGRVGRTSDRVEELERLESLLLGLSIDAI